MINTIRHEPVFSATRFGNRRVDIVGVGATGSRIALALAKNGVRNIHAWDNDVVEEHNIPNQVYGITDIGRPKVDALAELVYMQTDTSITPHNEKVTGRQRLGEVVFLLPDTMAARKKIWEGALKLRPHISLLIETRMGVDNGRIYTIDPSNPRHIRAWEKTLYGDDLAELSACGGQITVGSTAEIISGIAVWQMMKWAKKEAAVMRNDDDEDSQVEIANEVIFHLNPFNIFDVSFEQ